MARYLLTTGPTREALDPVRFLSNRSSGRMGFALAEALVAHGQEVCLVTGPVALPTPKGVERVDVESALQMLAACQELWPQCDGVFGVAAVADYRPMEFSGSKLKRQEGEDLVLRMTPNPDILQTLAAEKGDRLAVGFALETDHAEEEALRKLTAKHLDFLVLNGPEAQVAMESEVELFAADGRRWPLGPMGKDLLAEELVRLILEGNQDGFPSFAPHI